MMIIPCTVDLTRVQVRCVLRQLPSLARTNAKQIYIHFTSCLMPINTLRRRAWHVGRRYVVFGKCTTRKETGMPPAFLIAFTSEKFRDIHQPVYCAANPLFVPTILTTSSSDTKCDNPTLCGRCFALAPQTSAYLKLSFSVR
jgi:hypothetical protein